MTILKWEDLIGRNIDDPEVNLFLDENMPMKTFHSFMYEERSGVITRIVSNPDKKEQTKSDHIATGKLGPGSSDLYTVKKTTNYTMVREFSEKFSCTVNDKTTNISDGEKLLKIRLMNEELAELIAAMQLNDITLVADSIADLLYVVYGIAIAYGMPIDDVFAEVHRSNMTKSTTFDSGGKVTKGEDFELPDLEPILYKGRK